MKYYAHTAAGDDGTPRPESFWQPLATHLAKVTGSVRDSTVSFSRHGTNEKQY
jgi:hypothetical protein